MVMNILKQNIGNLNDEITIEVVKSDYQEAVNKSLKDLKKKTNIPGFRVGHVPMGMIARQYGTSIKIDEISKLINEKLEAYLKENNINVLFEPLAVPEKTKGDFEKGEDYSFTFEVGIRPDIKLDYNKITSVPYLKVCAGEDQIDEEEQKLRRRLGKFSSTEEVVDEDMMMVKFTEEGKEPVSSSITTKYIKEDYKKDFIGKKLHDSMTIDTTKVFVNDYARSTFLKCKVEELVDAPVEVKIEIDAIHHMDPAELNEEFFDRAFPDGKVKDEKAMRSRLKENIESMYVNEENMYYRSAAMEVLLSDLKLDLPDNFVKKYLVERDKNYTADNIEKLYPDVRKSICYQLIENEIANDGKIEVKRGDIINYLNTYIANNYMGVSVENLSEEQKQQAEVMANNMLKDQKTTANVYDNIYFERVTTVLKEKSGAKIKEVSREEFISAVSTSEEESREKKASSPKNSMESEKTPETEKVVKSEKSDVEEIKKTTPKKAVGSESNK